MINTEAKHAIEEALLDFGMQSGLETPSTIVYPAVCPPSNSQMLAHLQIELQLSYHPLHYAKKTLPAFLGYHQDLPDM